eukprot:TRINITY_DN5229_c0_g2_i3.p2 TRINITY_DN5229_c0_g2~~TRINITY_DN5229_c0_g2_i3.p2  ORF type:complete len:174 (-),score=15.38 TRINITY_DN5229_c0_g2_i3:473-994(-)
MISHSVAYIIMFPDTWKHANRGSGFFFQCLILTLGIMSVLHSLFGFCTLQEKSSSYSKTYIALSVMIFCVDVGLLIIRRHIDDDIQFLGQEKQKIKVLAGLSDGLLYGSLVLQILLFIFAIIARGIFKKKFKKRIVVQRCSSPGFKGDLCQRMRPTKPKREGRSLLILNLKRL